MSLTQANLIDLPLGCRRDDSGFSDNITGFGDGTGFFLRSVGATALVKTIIRSDYF